MKKTYEAKMPAVLEGMLDGIERFRERQSANHYAKRQQRKLYATVFRRVLALTLDLFVVMFFILPFLPPIPSAAGAAGQSLLSQSMSLRAPDILGNPQLMVLFWQLQLLQILVMAVYSVGFLVRFQTTPGMWVMRLWLRTADRVGTPTIGRCIRFFLWACPSWGLLSLGMVSIPLREDRRSVHELFSGTALVTGYFLAQQKKEAMGAAIAQAELQEATPEN